MKVTSLVFVIIVLASSNALRTASFSGALESMATIDFDDVPKKVTRFTQLKARALQGNQAEVIQPGALGACMQTKARR